LNFCELNWKKKIFETCCESEGKKRISQGLLSNQVAAWLESTGILTLERGTITCVSALTALPSVRRVALRSIGSAVASAGSAPDVSVSANTVMPCSHGPSSRLVTHPPLLETGEGLPKKFRAFGYGRLCTGQTM